MPIFTIYHEEFKLCFSDLHRLRSSTEAEDGQLHLKYDTLVDFYVKRLTQ